MLPTAVALRRQGASRGATTSFLIATPQTGVDSIAATYSLLGLPFAILRPVAALVGAALGGATVDRFARTSDGDGSNEEASGCCAVPVEDEYKGMSFGRKLLKCEIDSQTLNRMNQWVHTIESSQSELSGYRSACQRTFRKEVLSFTPKNAKTAFFV